MTEPTIPAGIGSPATGPERLPRRATAAPFVLRGPPSSARGERLPGRAAARASLRPVSYTHL
ncbi:hypothetical protein, partial [Streptomyces sp. wa1071]|uniref:hypothetical protein n=1 Tax=Streptomyces sp. wa1071 TaxID=1828217 RepID=UPI001C54DE09